MTYIAPNTDILFYRDLGLSMDHENTFYFASHELKDAYFTGLTALASAASCSYQRGTRGKMRVKLPMATLINAGYMRYKNSSFENRWFYAFVTDVEYINNEVTEVSFVIDDLMTYMGYFTLGQCMVEREHTATDAVGEHLIDEGLSTGDYVIGHVDYLTNYNPVLVISSSVEPDPDTSSSALIDVNGKSYYGNMLSGCAYLSFDISSSSVYVENALGFIEAVVGDTKQDSLISMRIVPDYCAPIENGMLIASDLTVASGGTAGSSYNITAIDGYPPVNKKMFSFPYICYEVINGEGGANEYRPELFANKLHPSFMYRGVSFDVCEVILIPQAYKQPEGSLELNYDEAIMMRDFPQASFDIDQYRAYIAQMTSGGGWLNVAGKVLDIATPLSMKQSSATSIFNTEQRAAASGLGLALDLMRDDQHFSALPPAVKGTSNANIMSAMGKKQFIGFWKTINYEKAKSIDDFFTMYGYKVNTVKTPVLNNRPHFTYIKTSGCIVEGSLPASAARAIENIFNRGVRFWVNPAEIGDYSQDNRPV